MQINSLHNYTNIKNEYKINRINRIDTVNQSSGQPVNQPATMVDVSKSQNDKNFDNIKDIQSEITKLQQLDAKISKFKSEIKNQQDLAVNSEDFNKIISEAQNYFQEKTISAKSEKLITLPIDKDVKYTLYAGDMPVELNFLRKSDELNISAKVGDEQVKNFNVNISSLLSSLGNNFDSFLLSIQKTNDGGYIVLGGQYEGAKSTALWMKKVDGDGKVQWDNKMDSKHSISTINVNFKNPRNIEKIEIEINKGNAENFQEMSIGEKVSRLSEQVKNKLDQSYDKALSMLKNPEISFRVDNKVRQDENISVSANDMLKASNPDPMRVYSLLWA